LAQLYLGIVAIAGLILLILHWGEQLPPPVAFAAKSGATAHAAHVHDSTFLGSVTSVLGENTSSPLSKLILQLIVIIATASADGSPFARSGQTAGRGEMVAGILLGPSLFGLLAPDAFQFVFAAPTLG